MRVSRIFASAALLFFAGFLASGCGSNPRANLTVTITSPTTSATLERGEAINITASVTNSNAVSFNPDVTWSLSGSGCTDTACGLLTNEGASSVTYTAPGTIPADLVVSVTATSVADSTKSASVNLNLKAIQVSMGNKLTEVAAGPAYPSFTQQFSARAIYDPTGDDVTWTLTADGVACSPACGTLSTYPQIPIPMLAIYTPPISVPAAPNDRPTVTATSVTDPTKSDSDTFTIFDGSTACGTGGNESELNGEYAIILQGWTGNRSGAPFLVADSFGADGAGKITGGQAVFNDVLSYSSSGAAIVPSASSYSVGADNRGCLTLTDQSDTTTKFRFSLGGMDGGIASKGDILLYNEQSPTPARAAGILRRQDPSAFSLSALAPNYTLGVDGWEGFPLPSHFALVGSFAQSGGSISSPSFDANAGGTLTSVDEAGPVNLGSIEAPFIETGMARATLPIPGQPGSVSVTIFIINASELFVVSNNLIPQGPVFIGRAIATPSSFSSASVSPNYMFRFMGGPSAAAAVSIGLASFSGGTSGSVSGLLDQYATGIATSQNFTGGYALNTNSGRLAITGSNVAASPICYLTQPIDGASAFCISTDVTASLGVFDAQPAATYSSGSLSGQFFFGSSEPGDASIPAVSGVASIVSGSVTGTKDEVATSGVSIGSPFSATLLINANGSGNLGPNTVAVTNGGALYFINEAAGAPAQVEVFEH